MELKHPAFAHFAQQYRERQRALTMAQALEASRRQQAHFKNLNALYNKQPEQITGAGA